MLPNSCNKGGVHLEICAPLGVHVGPILKFNILNFKYTKLQPNQKWAKWEVKAAKRVWECCVSYLFFEMLGIGDIYVFIGWNG